MTSTQNPTYFPALDGIRGLAILLVLFCHFTVFIPLPGWQAYFKHLAYSSYIGVDLFLVLSGFLITKILLEHKDISLKNFFIRRMLRIFPLYYFFLILFFGLFPLFLLHQTFDYMPGEQWHFWVYLFNFALGFQGVEAYPWFFHLWSLSAEEQFYFTIPFLLPLLRKPKHFYLAIAIVLILRVILYLNHFEVLNYTSIFSRYDAFLVGGVMAHFFRAGKSFLKQAALAITAITLLTFFATRGLNFAHSVMNTIGFLVISLFFGMMIYAALTKPFFEKLFSRPTLRFFGKYSYAMYLFHLPVARAIQMWFNPRDNTGLDWRQVIFYLMAISATTLISIVTWHTVEKPFLRLKTRFGY